MTDIYEGLKQIIKEENIFADADMKEFTSFRAGGKAGFLVMPQSREELKALLGILRNTEYMVMGNGSNILVKDGGYNGVIVKLSEAFGDIETEGELLKAGCGALMSSVAKAALAAELTGFEFAGGIPGSIGGAVFMNAGAYDGEMKDIIKEVSAISADGSEEKRLTVSQLDLGYRHSALQSSGDIVTDVVLQLKKGDSKRINEKMKDLTARRNQKQPVSYPSAGSFFKRPPGYYAGKLVQDAELKGVSVGGAEVSSLHSGFIINTGGATAKDIIELMHLVQNRVFERFGVMLEPEVRIIGED